MTVFDDPDSIREIDGGEALEVEIGPRRHSSIEEASGLGFLRDRRQVANFLLLAAGLAGISLLVYAGVEAIDWARTESPYILVTAFTALGSGTVGYAFRGR